MSLSERLRAIPMTVTLCGQKTFAMGEAVTAIEAGDYAAIHEAATTIDTQAAEIERLRASLAEAVGVLERIKNRLPEQMVGKYPLFAAALRAASDFTTKHGGSSE